VQQEHEKYIKRCLLLAQRGIGNVAPNPMVGSVIVHNNNIIGEGYHRKFGEAHAEVNAINSVTNKELLKSSTIYISLEPCAHSGKTPACTDLIIKMGIPKVVIGSIDPYFMVAGKGIEKLKNASIQLTTGVLEKECMFLNRRFYTFHTKRRPYIILKWAQSKDGFIDYKRSEGSENQPAWITDEYCRTLVHKWRTEENAIIVGRKTVILDNPQLTARNWYGNNPVRIAIDKMCEIDNKYKILDEQASTIIFNYREDKKINNLQHIKIDFSGNVIPEMLNILYQLDIQSVIVEGGTETLNSFIVQNLWDEVRLFVGNKNFGTGVKAPTFDRQYNSKYKCGNSELIYFYKK
jgi:diaminohydroxyphosphoribosylaminopyrimidine deaminase/5-amino-6-(5-phosphoribosylamino)uracil reductase